MVTIERQRHRLAAANSGVTIIFALPPANIRCGLTVLIHNSGHFGPPLPFWAPGPPVLPGLPMASYATGSETCRGPRLVLSQFVRCEHSQRKACVQNSSLVQFSLHML